MSKPRSVLLILTLVGLLNCMDRWLLAAIMPAMSHDLRLSQKAVGFLLSAFTIGYFLTSPIFSFLSDRWSRVKLIAGGTVIWSLATGLAGFVQSGIQVFLSRIGVGLGEAAGSAASQSLLFDFFPPAKRNQMMAIYTMAIPVGSALGFILGGYLTHSFGWRSAFILVGVPALLSSALVIRIREPARGVLDSARASGTPNLKGDLKALFANKAFMGTVYGSTAFAFSTGGIASWTPQFLVQVRHLPLEVADSTFGLITVAMGVVASLAGGWCGGYLLERLKRGRGDLLFAIGVTLIGVPLTFLCYILKTPVSYFTAFAVAEFFLFAGQPCVNVFSLECVPVHVRGLSIAVTSFIAHLLGDLIAAPLVGILADAYSLEKAILILPAALLPAIWYYVAAYRHERRSALAPEDLDKSRNLAPLESC